MLGLPSRARYLSEKRPRAIINSSAHHVVALVGPFGVHPSYLLDRGRKLLIIDREAIEILRDATLNGGGTRTGILYGSR
jgi:hypothetical protein